MAFIEPPRKIPIFIKLSTHFAERKTKKEMLIPKILAHYPKTAISSGILEALVAHDDKQVPQRLLQFIRIQVSLLVGCSFCLDMNTNEREKNIIIDDELQA